MGFGLLRARTISLSSRLKSKHNMHFYHFSYTTVHKLQRHTKCTNADTVGGYGELSGDQEPCEDREDNGWKDSRWKKRLGAIFLTWAVPH